MKDINWSRLAVVTAIHGEKFVGWIPEEAGDPKKYLDEHGLAGKPIELQDVRLLVGQATPSIDQRGNIVGISKMLLMMPIDVMNGPMTLMHIIPSVWYLVPENEAIQKKIEDLLNNSVETEARLSAADAGLHLPGIGRTK